MSEELKALLLTMNVPQGRIDRNDFGWFLRNLQIQNGNHQQFAEAMRLLRIEHNQRMVKHES
jgi:hypothetical protein